MSDLRLIDEVTAADLLRLLRAKGAKVGVVGGRVQISAKQGTIDLELQTRVRDLREELIELLRAETATESDGQEESSAAAAVRLSPAQSGLWLFHQRHPSSAAYNMSHLVRIDGPLDAARLDSAITAVLERHESLRSRVDDRDPAGLIDVLPTPSGVLEHLDVSVYVSEERSQVAASRIHDFQTAPFDLTTGIPFRALLIRYSPTEHQLATTIHHIALDGMSFRHFYRDLAAFYGGERPPALRTSYREYSSWINRYWTPQRIQDRSTFWQEELAGAPSVLELPTDFVRRESRTFEGAVKTAVLSAQSLEAVRVLAREEGASTFALMLAAFAAAIYRHSGQRDVVIGSPLHGRERSVDAELVGMFVNQLPLRVQLRRGCSLRDLVRTARETTMRVLAEHELPFGQIVNAVGARAEGGTNPLFQVLLNVLPPTDVETGLKSGDVTFELPDFHDMMTLFDGQSRFDMTLYVMQRDGELHLALVYSQDLFGDSTATDLLRTLEAVLAAAEDPDRDLMEVLEPSRGVRREVGKPARRATPVDAIAGIATTTPRAIALADESGSVTYDQLIRRSDALASALTHRLSGRNGAIAVMVPHDRSAATAILAVLRAGRAYVPLDPEYPLERLAMMAAEAGIAAVVVNAATRELARRIVPAGAEIVDLDALDTGAALLSAPPAASDLAYLLFTSGSTGRPKAVMQSHRNLLEQAARYAEMLKLGRTDRVALLASISFDASLMDLFGGLISGACVRPLDPRTTDFSRLPEIVRAEEITVLHVTPTLFRTIAQLAPDADWSSVRAVVLGGEPVRPDNIEYFDRTFSGDAKLLNLYGASEHSFSIGEFVDRKHRSLEVPAGLPLGDVEIRLMDSDGNPDPVRGEMVIRSRHNALGYLNQIGEQSHVFTADPEDSTRSWYRTGDLARRRPDGRYVVLGRVDAQVKVRGHRIEPSEVESALRKHADIRDVGVHAPVGPDGERVLVACYLPHPGATVDRRDLAAWCAELLPRYLVPTEWIEVDHLPRTPSGKVDRRALPTPDLSASDAGGTGALESQEEELLAGIWSAVLGREGIGREDDFFELGGHSLRAVEVVARVRDAFGIDLPLRTFFERSTIAGLAEWLTTNRAGAPQLPPLVVREGEAAPLSFAQERVWLFQQLEPEASTYNVTPVMHVEGALDVERLRSALRAVLERQEPLRSLVISTSDGVQQHVQPVPTDLLPLIDLSGLSAEERQARLESLVREENRKPFHLDREPPFRGILVRHSAEAHDLVVTLHHLATDWTSTRRFFEELRTAYHGGELEPLPVRYRDYAAWERECWSGDRLEQELGFWREYLSEAPSTLSFPTDRARDADRPRSGELIARLFGQEHSQALLRVARSEGASPYMLLLAAFGAALHRHTGQRDVVIGTPVSGRSRSELRSLMGMFINQLPIRLRISRDDSFRSLLRSARTSALQALSHQEMPFPRLVEALAADADRSQSPIFQVMLNVLPPDAGAVARPGEQVTFRDPDLQEVRAMLDMQSKFDFTLYAIDRAGELQLGFMYESTLFDASRMERFVDDVERMLSLAVESPDQLLEDVWREEAGALLPTPQPAASSQSGATVVDQFLPIAQRAADRPAIIGGGETISYGNLRQRAAQIAHAVIRETEATPDATIGISVPHDHQAVASLLGVLASGRPYVPLDPSYPEERLRFMLDDAKVGIILTTRALQARVAELAGETARILLVEDALANSLATAQLPSPPPEATAYLLYTSGSTGRPKAVVQTHANLLEQATRYAHALQLSDADRLAWLASISFDASLMDIFGALVSGAALAPIDARQIDLAQLPAIVTEQRLSVLHVTPTVFRSLGRVVNTAFPTIRAVVLGGEPVRPEEIAFFDERFNQDAILYNLYGASEHSFSLGGVVDRKSRSAEVPLGFPVGDVEAILVDEDGSRDSVQGQLMLRSRHTALGYRNAPELTDRVFMTDPENPERRLYRTGDIVRQRPDGAFVFVRRADQQLKVRGHRIEAYEVERVLRDHPAIAEVAVHAPLGVDGDASLVACIAFAADADAVSPQELATWCGRQLPNFMVPTGWAIVDRLPRTPSGKVDRSSLPVGGIMAGSSGAIEARDADEAELHQIWGEVLGRRDFGVEDDFFEYGGHSLSATQVVARIRDVMGVELPLRQFFDHPTIAGTAFWLRENRQSSAALPPIIASSNGHNAPLSFSQERLWFLQQMDSAASAYNMATANLLEGPLDLERLRLAIDQVARRQESLRTTIAVERGKPVQVVSPEPCHDFFIEDVSGLPQAERLDAARALTQQILGTPYDTASGPLTRIVVVRMGEDRHLLGLGTHHTVSDMWSYGIIGREIRIAYEMGDLAPLPVSYRDYSTWQREWLQGDALSAQIEYWRQRLQGLGSLDIPTDYPRPPFISFEGDVLRTELSTSLRERLQRFSVANRATPFMTLLAGFNAMLSAYAKSDDIAVGVPIAGRRSTEVQETVGTFVNTLVHRNDLSGDPSFQELVARIRSSALDAYAHQDAPIELLVKELQPPRDTSRAPFFQVLFNVANMQVDTSGLKGIRHSHVPLERKASQFDFSVNVGLNDAMSEVQLTFNTALFTRETAQRLLNHYLEILERAVANPQQRLSELRTPPPADRKLLVEDWNATERPYPIEENLLTLLEQQVARNPHATAVDSPTGSFTYAELLAYARGVSAELRTVGVQPGDRVAIVMSRSREMVGALLGILGSGAAYVPVDPNYPPARVRYMLEDSGASAIVSHRGLERPYEPQVPVVQLDDWQPATQAPFATLQPTDAAYVIYTSGSTGLPKGVEISHGAMANFLLTMQEEPGFTEHDRLLAVTTISFDIAVLELYLPLIAGGRVVIASEDEALDGRRLMRLIDEAEITMMQATPATWKLMLAAGWTMSPRLRVLCGGEPLPRVLADDLLDRVDELWNMYGPTETTVWSTVEKIHRDQPILVGKPIANTTVYVLRDDLSLCPVGVPGELYIGGRGVANGYVNRPEMTADRFIPDPFRPGETIYRTGDLVRFRSDGRLEHLGRLDNQVKVRGFRIELGEVESALQSHEAVRDAVVIAADDRLVGYVVLQPGAHATTTELRSWVSGSLPPYMVPALVMTLDELPLTPNGKVDRKQLPAPTGATVEPREVQLPSNPMERVVAEVWATLLGVEEISASDNFFELGGHSLLAMEAVALIEERTGYRPEPRSLFFMTLGEIAASVSEPVLEA